ncbi:hypothetical protein [Cognatishimia sp.]|uniref:hypothetical protein n=1 Tax=Cognatishimia sp. TaxID=2211648 RepID=UPI0035187827
MALKGLIYRPDRNVGFGHTIYAMSHYAAMAQALNVPFFSTLHGPVYSLGIGEDGLQKSFFQSNPAFTGTARLRYRSVQSRLRRAWLFREKALLIGRDIFPNRATDEFAYLKRATKLEYKNERDSVTPENLGQFDLVYVDNVLPDEQWSNWYGQVTSPLLFSEKFRNQVRQTLGMNAKDQTYIAVHARHGNGEYLDGRISGDAASFDAFLQAIANTAREKKAKLFASEIICLSDNAETAQKLADYSGGRPVGGDRLPDQTFHKFVRSDPSLAAERVQKTMFDFATLAGAVHIVGGQSLFPRAASLMGQNTGLSLSRWNHD